MLTDTEIAADLADSGHTDADTDCPHRQPTPAQPEDAGQQPPSEPDPPQATRRWPWTRILAYAVLPALVMSLAVGAGYLKWRAGSAVEAQTAAAQSVRAATATTIAMLSYRADTVDKDLPAARDRLTGPFADQYNQLVHDIVIPGAKQKNITATATVPAAASVSASENHAVVLVFIDQTVTVGTDPPTNTASSVRITLDEVHDRWLISAFDPI